MELTDPVVHGEDRGTYILIVYLERDCLITVGRLGPIMFRSGTYAYCGSAMSGYRGRVGRHFSSEKKVHWHIDYLLEEAAPVGAFLVKGGAGVECALVRLLSALTGSEPIVGFGSSDCSCISHLYHIEDSSMTLLTGAIEEFSLITEIPLEND